MDEDPPQSAPRGGPLGAFSVVSRRRWMGLGAGAVAMATGGGLSLRALRGRVPRVPHLRCLSAAEHYTLSAVADAIVPTGGAFLLGAAQCGLADAFDAYLADEHPSQISDLKTALGLVELGPLIYDGRWRTFPRLEAAARAAHWSRWERADDDLRRQVALAFRRFVLLVFYDRPEAWRAIGYPGPALR